MMFRTISLILGAALTLLAFNNCGKDNDSGGGADVSAQSTSSIIGGWKVSGSTSTLPTMDFSNNRVGGIINYQMNDNAGAARCLCKGSLTGSDLEGTLVSAQCVAAVQLPPPHTISCVYLGGTYTYNVYGRELMFCKSPDACTVYERVGP
jgi:hypothetical protein